MKWRASYRCECGGKYVSTLPFQELHCLDCGKPMKAHIRRIVKKDSRDPKLSSPFLKELSG